MTLPPRVVHHGGEQWSVRRAWPSSNGCDLEVMHADGRLRAGRWRDGRAHLLEPGVDRHLPALAQVSAAGPVISWRRGRRIVIRANDGGGFVKVVRRETVDTITRAHERAESFRRGFATPALTVLDDTGAVRLSRVAGSTLFDLGADRRVSDTAVRTAWCAFSRGWERVLTAPPDPDAARYTPADEAEVLVRWRDHALRAGVDPGTAAAFDRAARQLVTDPGDPSAAAHRDLHDKQILFDGDSVGLIDLDTAARAEPALDLGNLRAHVAWRLAQGRLSVARARGARDAIDEVTARAEVDPARVAVYEKSTRLRLGAVYLFRPAWRTAAARWLAVEAAQTRR
ncbi:hypothetical protein ACIPVB_01670 [Microbacterium sp. NPDC090007]|uniref:hypothetical protein n=1 Tax=Microbacterium sp. NPDC090007 TaxID=3364204 RepID=UPI0038291DA8